MKTFWEVVKLREDAMGSPMGGAPMPGGMPGGDMGGMGGPMGGGMPPIGGGGMGGLPGGDMGGMGGPMGGAPGAAPPPVKQLKPSSVWDVLNDILDGKKVELKKDKKPSGQAGGDMLQNAQLPPEPPPQLPQGQPLMQQPPGQQPPPLQ